MDVPPEHAAAARRGQDAAAEIMRHALAVTMGCFLLCSQLFAINLVLATLQDGSSSIYSSCVLLRLWRLRR